MIPQFSVLLKGFIIATAITTLANRSNGGDAPPLPLQGTSPLVMTGDIASNLVAGVDRFLLSELGKSVERRAKYWHRDYSSADAYERSIEPNRRRFAHILGIRDKRVSFDELELNTTVGKAGELYAGTFKAYSVRWPAFGDVTAEGLLLVPQEHRPDATTGTSPSPASAPWYKPGAGWAADIIAVPDADQTPEDIAGLTDAIPVESQFARRLVESGCRVLIPTLIDRTMGERKVAHFDKGTGLSNREFIYRSAFELGRHLIGYEVQKILAAVDWLAKQSSGKPLGIIGWGEGGMIALYTAALDTRVQAACISGWFDDRNGIWQQPIDRNVFGLLEQFGDAEVASLVTPRHVIIEASRGPEVTLPGKGGGAPAKLATPQLPTVKTEFERLLKLIEPLSKKESASLIISENGTGHFGSKPALQTLLSSFGLNIEMSDRPAALTKQNKLPDSKARMKRQIHELDRHNQQLLIESPYVRAEFMKNVKTDTLENFASSMEAYRSYFYEEVIGRFDLPLAVPSVRSRQSYETNNWIGYEVVMDVFQDVIAYGILLVPKGLKPEEKRPVIVCQHGLEGRPQDVIFGDHWAYHNYAAKLAEQGFITFSPQNLYIFEDRFRTLQRKANPLKKTLFSVITPQHQQIVNWLKTLPHVDSSRIAFYGLSYGGKTAMRVPALVKDYCLSICSADFNEWVWKNASTRSPYSYVWTGEYEIFEFDLGSTFNYAEMAALIAPRPFMVERGHFDGVAPDETVAYEFAKVRHLYNAKLKLENRCVIEWFAGPHTINGKGTFEFLRQHLGWAKKD